MSGMSRDKTLASGEEPIFDEHPHWKVLVGPVALATLVLAVAVAAEVMIPFGTATPVGQLILAAVALAGVAWATVVPLLRWRTTRYQLTTRRLRMRSGIIARVGHDIPLYRISDVSFETGLLDRLLGAGTLVVESPGEHGEVRLTQIPRVQEWESRLFQLLEEERQRALLRKDPEV